MTTIAHRRRVTAADFTADPLHELARTQQGRWQVTDPTGPIGEVHRHGSRWQPTSTTGDPLGPETYPTRAEAALHVITAHQTRTHLRPRHSTPR